RSPDEDRRALALALPPFAFHHAFPEKLLLRGQPQRIGTVPRARPRFDLGLTWVWKVSPKAATRPALAFAISCVRLTQHQHRRARMPHFPHLLAAAALLVL